MSALFHKGSWFDLVAAGSQYETSYEETLIAYGNELYPGFTLIVFKELVDSPYGRAKADLALIDVEYRNWWVVEVELGDHPLSHVEDQVQRLSTASYPVEIVDRLTSKNDGLDAAKLRDMFLGAQPEIFVVVNAEREARWATNLARHGAVLGAVKVYRSRDAGPPIIEVSGDHPQPLIDVVTICRRGSVPNALTVESPAALGIAHGETIRLRHTDGVSEWRRLDTGGSVWLMTTGKYPLPLRQSTFTINRDAAGEFVISEAF